jgi:ribosomal protein S12 methylthiotransferase accessory factor
VLPTGVVSLYSEDRKFFLHGELYCALAPAIAAGQSVTNLFASWDSIFRQIKSMKRFSGYATGAL